MSRAAYFREYREKRRARGLCQDCGRRGVESAYCRPCRDRRNIRGRAVTVPANNPTVDPTGTVPGLNGVNATT